MATGKCHCKRFLEKCYFHLNIIICTPRTHRVHTAYTPRAQCTPRTHRVHHAYTPRTHRVHTACTTRTHRVHTTYTTASNLKLVSTGPGVLRRLAYATSKIVNNNTTADNSKPPRPGNNKVRQHKGASSESRHNLRRITNASRTDLSKHDHKDSLDTGLVVNGNCYLDFVF